MPLTALTARVAALKPIVKYNHPDGSKRSFGATVERLAVRPSTPANFTSVTTNTTGGVLGATVVTEYKYTAVRNGVESLPNATVGTVTTGAGTTNTVTLTIPANTEAQFFRIYTTAARTAGTRLLLATVPNAGGATVYTDTGTITPSGAEPSGALPAGSVTLRIPSYPGLDGTVAPRTLPTVQPATTPGQAGRYEYYSL